MGGYFSGSEWLTHPSYGVRMLLHRRSLALRTSQNSVYANFHEKALFVKGRRGGPLAVERNDSVSFALCFHPHCR